MTKDLPNEDVDWIHAALAQHEAPLLRYAAHILDGDVERARDVVQDTFLRLCRQSRESVSGHIAEWLYTVCRNRALDVRRKETRMKRMTDEMVAEQKSRDKDHVVDTECRDTAAQILKAVDRLTDNQREVIRLKFQHGLSYREIGRICGLSISNVGYLIHTALDKVRGQMNVPTPRTPK